MNHTGLSGNRTEVAQCRVHKLRLLDIFRQNGETVQLIPGKQLLPICVGLEQ